MSIFSSEGFPWGGLLALVLLVGADRLVLGDDGAWPWIHSLLAGKRGLVGGVASDRLALQEIRARPEAHRRVAIVGDSRALAAFFEPSARRVDDVDFAILAHAGVDPFAVHTLLPDLIDARIDAVVLMVSAFDTHRPLRLEPVPGKSAADLSSIIEVVGQAGALFAVENRSSLYGLVASSMMKSYRYREVVAEALLDRLISFRFDQRFPRAERLVLFEPVALFEADRESVDVEKVRELRGLLPEIIPSVMISYQVRALGEIASGRHARVQMELLRQVVEALAARRVEILLIEPPVHPAVEVPRVPRQEFLDFATFLQTHYGVEFIPYERLGDFRQESFGDVLHVLPAGARRVTNEILAWLRRTERSRPPVGDKGGRW